MGLPMPSLTGATDGSDTMARILNKAAAWHPDRMTPVIPAQLLYRQKSN